MLFDKPLCFVDIETTGTSVTHDRIIEVGMLKVVENEIIDTYESLINPNAHVSPFITSITGIAPADLEDAPSFEAIYPEIYKFLEGSIFVAHNARFDYGFIRQEFGRFEISYSSPLLCTVRLSRLLYPRYKRHNLDSIIERFNINCARRHRALDDSRVMFEFFTQAQQSFPIETIEKAVNTILKKPSLPVNVSNAILDDLPQSPGVYIF
ncbi:MAG: 3'-5' exonuclease, partial [Microgenomates group bacterium]